jgi:hypothetical protein
MTGAGDKPTFAIAQGARVRYLGTYGPDSVGRYAPGCLDGVVIARRFLLHGAEYRVRHSLGASWLPENTIEETTL